MTERVASLTEGGGKPAGFDGRSLPRSSGAFAFGNNCQKELRNLGDMPVDMQGGGMAKINSDG